MKDENFWGRESMTSAQKVRMNRNQNWVGGGCLIIKPQILSAIAATKMVHRSDLL